MSELLASSRVGDTRNMATSIAVWVCGETETHHEICDGGVVGPREKREEIGAVVYFTTAETNRGFWRQPVTAVHIVMTAEYKDNLRLSLLCIISFVAFCF